MNSRQRVRACLERRPADRAPRLLYGEAIGYVPAIANLLAQRCAPRLPREHFQMDITGVAPDPSPLTLERFRDYWADQADQVLASGALDEWGVWWRSGGFHHFAHIESPLRSITTLEQIRSYPWPDLDQASRYQDFARTVRSRQEQGYAVCAFAGSVFEQGWYLRGMDELMMDMACEPAMAHELLEHTACLQQAAAEHMARAGVDIIITGDDVAMQTGLMMSMETWQTYLKPRLQRTVQKIKAINPACAVFYHSDGNVEPLIPELIEIGIDILNPVQPECMDPARIQQLYGDDLIFWGAVSVQQTMPFGTPQQVRQEIHERLATIGRDGGYILAPAHVLGPEVGWENIAAFFEAADAFER